MSLANMAKKGLMHRVLQRCRLTVASINANIRVKFFVLNENAGQHLHLHSCQVTQP